MASPLSTTTTNTAIAATYPFYQKRSCASVIGTTSYRTVWKVSCKARNGDQKPTQGSATSSDNGESSLGRMDRRNVLIGLGGMYGAAGLSADQFAFGDPVPKALDSVVRTVVERPKKKKRSKKEKEEEEEILVISGIELERDVFAKFDVLINDEDDTKITPANSKFAGSFVNVPQKLGKREMKVKTSLRLGLTNLLEDLGAEDDETVVVTLVPRQGKFLSWFCILLFLSRSMDQIQHKYIDIRGLKLHVAEAGTGPSVVVFLHGFPEIWYSWRHQMIAVANAGHRAIAPDFRGYGLSEKPPEPEKASYSDLLDDLLAIFDSFSINKAFLIGKDFGARPTYLFALLHPERVSGVVTLGVPYIPPTPSAYNFNLPEGLYILRWQEPGRAEADFGRFDVKTVVRNIYILFSGSEIPIAGENQEIMDLVDPSTPLPPWFTEEDLTTYAALYENSGFCTPLKVPYRSLREEFNITDPKVRVPVLLIMGGKDYVIKFPGREDYITSGKVKEYVPDLEITFLPEGTHFVQEQFPDQVNQLIISFLNNHA
ncbi:hypothetical protein HHK36_001905 [Tetracentron sinense]|uniref:AB hydrolase-1 domain-containing protein n=1 Tax=Tetracentron sinense TaxID=13715 RepID=A0A834ZTJ4_TETSI|nr:hypothetical protein HHK36_001905 [Tetracentron sinense]